VDITGAEQSSLSCSTTCQISGLPGTYHIAVTAPGYAPAERSIEVRGTKPPCGCASSDTQSVTIALSPSAESIAGRF
jgi:hypothetical protein